MITYSKKSKREVWRGTDTMAVGVNTMLIYLIGLILVYLLIKALIVPLKYLGKLVINVGLGGLGLWLINMFSGTIGVQIGINFVTAMVVGLLGVPGLLLLMTLQWLKI